MDRTGLVTVGDIAIAYSESGSGEPLVLIHGGESSRHQYDNFTPLLAPGIQSITYDQRDSGDSLNPETPYSIEDLAGDCAALIVGLGFRRAHIFGSSFGGMVALQVAVSAPEVVRTLIVGAAYSDASALQNPAVHDITQQGPQQRQAQLLDAVLSPAGQRSSTLVGELRSTLVQRSPEADQRRLGALRTFNVTDRLGRITAPTLLIYGQDDPLAGPPVGRHIAAHIPGARLEIIPGARHGITLEHRDFTAGLICAFIDSHRPDTTT